MARAPRIDYPGAVHHVMNRGAAGQAILRSDADKSLLLDLVSREAVARHWSCHAFCLMTNHFHLVVETPLGDLATGMHRVGTCFAQEYNRAYEARGHVFHGRFQSIPVEDEEYAVDLARYLAMNPVEAGLCAAPEEWPWSSYAVTLAGGAFLPGFGDGWVLGLLAARRTVAVAGLRALMGPGTVKNP
jgi:REP-associated tyrosine transposase